MLPMVTCRSSHHRFPRMFEYLNSNPKDDMYYEADLFPEPDGLVCGMREMCKYTFYTHMPTSCNFHTYMYTRSTLTHTRTCTHTHMRTHTHTLTHTVHWSIVFRCTSLSPSVASGLKAGHQPGVLEELPTYGLVPVDCPSDSHH